MRFSYDLVMLFLVSAVVITVGCTQEMDSAASQVMPVPAVTPNLPDLALSQADVPACFSLSERHEKKTGEVGPLAKDLGWQAGYVVAYTCPGNGPEPTVIVHSLAVYPAGNMPGISSMAEKQDRTAGIVYEELIFPGNNATLRGFYGNTSGTQASGVSPGSYVINGGRNVPETNTMSGSTMAEIIFYRGTVFEVLKMTGPGTDIPLLRQMTEKALSKIP
jgi:hypothetical protein